jgi:hypothetical protein
MSHHLKVRWAPRDEPLATCAGRLARMLERLEAVHPNLTHWRRKAKTRAAAYKPFCAMPPSLPELEGILLRGRHFASASKELMPELGYSAAAWNGLDEPQSLSLRLSVGVYYERWLYPNDIRVDGLQAGNQLVSATNLKRILLAIAECWDADWGVVDTWGYQGVSLDAEGRPLLPYGGWLTYLASAFAEKVAPPPGVTTERTFDGGLFMLVSDEPFDVTNATHVGRLDAVQKALAPVQRTLASAFNRPSGSSGTAS